MFRQHNNNNGESPHVHYKNMADDAITLQILDFVEKDESISQHKIIMRTGLATGLVHSYMSKVINKGLVKAKQVSARRWFYYLTPEGFVEKSRLTIKYLSYTLTNYREANRCVRKNLETCFENNWRKLVVAGDNELAEICALNIKAMDRLQLVGEVSGAAGDAISARDRYTLSFSSIENTEYDRILVCDLDFMEWMQQNGKHDLSTLYLHV